MYEGLLDVFDKYGYYLEDLRSLTLKGIEGAKQIQAILNEFRENPPDEISGHQVVVQEDYLSGKRFLSGTNREEDIKLPKSNVLKYFLEDGTWVCLRPSGTEPKVKFYFGVQGSSMKEAQGKLSTVTTDFMKSINKML
jgi:phosphoglucomutase